MRNRRNLKSELTNHEPEVTPIGAGRVIYDRGEHRLFESMLASVEAATPGLSFAHFDGTERPYVAPAGGDEKARNSAGDLVTQAGFEPATPSFGGWSNPSVFTGLPDSRYLRLTPGGSLGFS